MPRFLKPLLLVVATSATMLVAARDVNMARERGLRQGHDMDLRNLQAKSTKAPKSTKSPSTKAPKSTKAPALPSSSKKGKGKGGFTVEVAFAPEARIDITLNETFTNETFAPESLTNETLPPTEVVSNETDSVPATRLKLVGAESACVTYNQTLSVEDCDVAGGLADWEILGTGSELFQLRHVESQLCIPENPEFPDRPFNCWLDQSDKAIGDTINGLVNCSTPFAALVGFIDPENPSYLYNAVCSVGDVGAPTDVVLLAYTADGSTELLWGEKVLLDVPQMTADSTYTLSGSFFLIEE